MACEWCGIPTDSGNHATTTDCIVALEGEVLRLRQIIDDRKRFAERVRLSETKGRQDAAERPAWRFKTK